MGQIDKLAHVNAKLGATTKGQQTTRVIYDTVTPGAGSTFFDFFQSFSGKGEFETNLTANKLDASESMVIKSIYLQTIEGTSPGALKLDQHVKLNVYVGNQNVIKDLDVSFNTNGRGTSFDRLHSGTRTDRTEIRLLTDIVIPPQAQFRATVEYGGASTDVVADSKMVLQFKGYGLIFSAGNSF